MQSPVDDSTQPELSNASASIIEPTRSQTEPELSFSDLPDDLVSLTQPTSFQFREEFISSTAQEGLEPQLQRRRLEGPPNFGHPGSAPLSLGRPLYPPFPA